MPMIHIVSAIIFFAMQLLSAGEQIVSIPGINGDKYRGHAHTVLTSILGFDVYKHCILKTIPISSYPWRQPDFGQNRCVKIFGAGIVNLIF